MILGCGAVGVVGWPGDSWRDGWVGVSLRLGAGEGKNEASE